MIRKAVIAINTILVITSLVLISSGCNQVSPIVGKWQDIHGDGIIEFTRSGDVVFNQYITGKYELIGKDGVMIPAANGTSASYHYSVNGGTLVITSSNGSSNSWKRISYETSPAQTLTTTPYDVQVKTTVSKTSLSAGENLTIHSDLQYIGGESPIQGCPAVMILDNQNHSLAVWFFDQQGNTLVSKTQPTFFQMVKGDRFTCDITWDLTILSMKGNPMPAGQYKISSVILKLSSSGKYLGLRTNEEALNITINP